MLVKREQATPLTSIRVATFVLPWEDAVDIPDLDRYGLY